VAGPRRRLTIKLEGISPDAPYMLTLAVEQLLCGDCRESGYQRVHGGGTIEVRSLDVTKAGEVIEARIRVEDWEGARALIERALRRHSDDHWLLTRLGLTYYEQRDYDAALDYETRAHELAPDCPLVLWDLAGTLDMLGREPEAIVLYKGITGRTLDDLAHGPCGEGMNRARGLVVDSYYRIGHAYQGLGDRKAAADMYRRAVKHKGRDVESIYPHKLLEDALRRAEE